MTFHLTPLFVGLMCTALLVHAEKCTGFVEVRYEKFASELSSDQLNELKSAVERLSKATNIDVLIFDGYADKSEGDTEKLARRPAE